MILLKEKEQDIIDNMRSDELIANYLEFLKKEQKL